MLRAVGRVSAGAEHRPGCLRAGVEVVRPATASAQAEAEFMIGALLSMLRRVPVINSDGMLVGGEIGAATVGLIGMTAGSALDVASCSAPRLQRWSATTPAARQRLGLWRPGACEPMGLRQLLESADAVCVQLAYFSRYQGPARRPLPAPVRAQPGDRQHRAPRRCSTSARWRRRRQRMAAAWFDSLEPGARRGRPPAGIVTLQVTPRVASTTRESRLRSAWAVARRIDELVAIAPQPQRDFRPTDPSAPADLADGPLSP